MAKTKTMVLVFGFSFPCCANFQGSGGLVSGESGFSFWFLLLPERGGSGHFASFERKIRAPRKTGFLQRSVDFVQFSAKAALPKCRRFQEKA